MKSKDLHKLCYPRMDFEKLVRENDFAGLINLIENGFNVNVEGGIHPPLIFTVSKNNISATKILLEHGADPDVSDMDSNLAGIFGTPLLKAIEQNNSEMVSLLLEYNANPSKGSIFTTPILKAVELRNIQIISSLLEKGAEVNGIGETLTEDVLYVAKLTKNPEIISLVKQYGAKHNANAEELLATTNGRAISLEEILGTKNLDFSKMRENSSEEQSSPNSVKPDADYLDKVKQEFNKLGIDSDGLSDAQVGIILYFSITNFEPSVTAKISAALNAQGVNEEILKLLKNSNPDIDIDTIFEESIQAESSSNDQSLLDAVEAVQELDTEVAYTDITSTLPAQEKVPCTVTYEKIIGMIPDLYD